MAVQQSIRHKPARPHETLYSGKGLAGVITAPPAGVVSGVGSAQLPEGNYGSSTPISDNIYFHVKANRLDSGDCTIAAYLSVGPTCISGPPDAQEALDWLQDGRYRAINIKRVNNASLGAFLLMAEPVVDGNYVQILDEAMEPYRFDLWLEQPSIYYGPLFTESTRGLVDIGQLRDCKIWLNPYQDEIIRISWQEVYTADANEETLWLLEQNGQLYSQIRIRETELDGYRDIPVRRGRAYQLVVPGYSFRNYTLSMSEGIRWIIEPAKLQFTGFLPADSTFYFKVGASESASFCMKDYNRGAIEGPYGAYLTRLDDNLQLTLDLTQDPKTYYYEHSTLPLPVSEVETTWEVKLIGQGRAAFWLDGTDNIFADRLINYERPPITPNSVVFVLPAATPANRIGHVPLVGHYMPYTTIPLEARGMLSALKAQTANIYTFADVMAASPDWEDGFRGYMSTEMALQRDYTIMANTGRNPVLNHDRNQVTRDGLDNWIDLMYRLNDGREHYIALADEPNLNYPTFEEFEAHFVSAAEAIRNNPKSAAAKIKISAVASSRFDHGTTVDDSYARKGLHWTTQIVNMYPHLVDAIVWHEWTVRGLLNVRQYAAAVEAAYALSDGGNRRVVIEQTNTSGGQSVSLYDQNTHFASLWWAGVFIAVTNTGKLDDLMWFPIADELDHPKGLLYVESGTTFKYKPVAYFHMFLMDYLYHATDSSVYRLQQPMIEVDACYFTNVVAGVTRHVVLGVNKSNRPYTTYLADVGGVAADWRLRIFTSESKIVEGAFTLSGGVAQFEVPPEGIWAFSRGVTSFSAPITPWWET